MAKYICIRDVLGADMPEGTKELPTPINQPVVRAVGGYFIIISTVKYPSLNNSCMSTTQYISCCEIVFGNYC